VRTEGGEGNFMRTSLMNGPNLEKYVYQNAAVPIHIEHCEE